MKWSKYNYLFQDNNNYFIYNALSNSFAEIDVDSYNLFKLLSVNPEHPLTSVAEEDISLMKEAKFIADDYEEYLRIKHSTQLNRFDNSFLSLTINPTLDCNFNCPYCFESENRKKEYMDDKTEEEIIKFINTKISSINGIYLTWFGGEPLLAFKRIVSLTQSIKNLNVPFGAKMITNGYLLSKTKIELLDSLCINSVQITIDGTKDVHNSRRKLLNNQGTFDKIVENISNILINSKTHIIIRVNIDESNKNEYINVCKYFSKKVDKNYYNRISIVPGFVDDINSCSNDSCLFDRNKKSIFLIETYKKYGIDAWGFFPSSERYECPTRNINTFTIGPKGELYKCWNDVGKPEKVIGVLGNNKGITNAMSSILLKYLSDADPLDNAECKACFYFPICGGGCPYERISNETGGKLFDTCDLMKDHIEDFLKLHLHSKRTKHE
ncbi:4Fe-4S single cluster domain protein [anaerobic digester metagenome]